MDVKSMSMSSTSTSGTSDQHLHDQVGKGCLHPCRCTERCVEGNVDGAAIVVSGRKCESGCRFLEPFRHRDANSQLHHADKEDIQM
eukprot:5276553-Amphidinium_carterae.1